jgi:hypothetical protein
VPPALQQARAAALQSPPMRVAPTTLPDSTLFQAGPVALRSHLTYRYLHATGIPSAPGQDLSTVIHDITPEFLLDVGTRWMIDYTPTWRFYSNRAFNDTVNHSARFAGGASYENWTFSVTQSFSLSSSSLIETGRQTKEEDASTNLGATWQIISRLALELTGAQQLRYVWAQPDAFEWSTLDWLHYQAAPGVDTAIGLGYGYVDVTEGPDMTFGRYLGRIGWKVTDLISLHAQGGMETRSSRAAGAGDMNNFVLDASIQYRPMEATVLSLSASRAIAASYFAGQVTRNAEVGATLQQRLLGKLYLSIGAQHGTATYIASATGVTAGREDTFNSFDLRLSAAILRRGTVAATYQHRRNSSNANGFGLTSNQYGFEVSWRF